MMSSMFCNQIYRCKNKNWCARDFNPKSDVPECFEPITNYDRLISKSPAELAKWIARQTTAAGQIVPDEEYRYRLEWLQQEVES